MEEEMKVQKLIDQIRNGSVQQRCAAIVDLEQMGVQEVVPVFLELLDYPDVGVRANIAHAIGVLGNKNQKDVRTALLTLLEDSDPLVRINAAESLGVLEDSESVHSLVNVLNTDIDPLVRLHAAEALGRIKDIAALPALTEALDDTDEGVRAYSAGSIGDLGVAQTSPILKRKLDSESSIFTRAFLLSALYQLGNEDALFSLIKLSETANDILATTILNLAVELATPQNVGMLKDMIRTVTQSRPTLGVEVDSLIKRLDSLHNTWRSL